MHHFTRTERDERPSFVWVQGRGPFLQVAASGLVWIYSDRRRLAASHFPSAASQVLPMRVRLKIQGGRDPTKVAILVVAVAASCLIGTSCFALADTESPNV
jgi:hypothetical protein